MPRRPPDYRKLALRQRWIIWLVLLSIGTSLWPLMTARVPLGPVQAAVELIVPFAQIAIHVLIAAGVVLLLTAEGHGPILAGLCGLIALAPCGNVLMLLAVNRSVTRTFRRAGVRVGLMGVDPQQLERVLNPRLCRGCGYDLRGNVSGICPECGRVVEHRSAPVSGG